LATTALNLASRGKPTFPCKPDKTPHTPHGHKDATTNPARITAWWSKWPEANIGIPTGKASGLLVVDLDSYKPGAMTVAEFEEKYGVIPDTATVRTGGGGVQFYFLYPDGEEIRNSTGMLGPSVDVRGAGGYILAPPSVTTERYEWLNKAPPAPVPPKLLEALRGEPRSPNGRSGRSRSGAGIPDEGAPIHEGARDETLTRIAGRLHDGSRDLGQLEADLQAENEARCVPPLAASQVLKIARSIIRREPCRPARRAPDEKTVEALDKIERAILRREWKGQSGKTDYSIAVAVLKLARKHGTLVEDGVRVEASARQLALAAAVSRRTIANKLKNMGDVLRPDNENVEPGKSGSIVLLLPRATLHHSNHQVSSRGKEGGCAKWRAPFSAPRLRWSSPARKPRRGVTPGTCKVRDGIVSKKRDAIIRLGKSCEKVMDSLEAAGGAMTLDALADAVGVKRPRDLTRRKNPETGKGRDGFVTRLANVGVLEVDDDVVVLNAGWLEALDRERERAGEIALYKRDMRRFNQESKAYRSREKVEAENAPSEADMDEYRATRPALSGDALRAFNVLADPNTRASKAYAAGGDLDILAGALAAHVGDARGDPAAWRRWLDPVARALTILDGECAA
jgi:hypothetical protein